MLPVAVLLLALLTVWVVVFSRENGSAGAEDMVAATATPTGEPEELVEAWDAPPVRAGADESDRRATRLWAHDSTVTLVSTAGVTGYDTVDGVPRWQVDPPMGGTRPCAASDATNSAGVGAVLYRAEGAASPDATPAADCSVLAVIDTTTGALLWSERFERPVVAADATVTVGEEAVTVGLEATGAVEGFHRFAVGTGEPLAFPAPPEDGGIPLCQGGREPLSATHVGSRVAVLTRCGGADDPGGERELSVYHADTGALEWTHPVTDPALGLSGILAGDPVLLFQGDDLVAYAETGEEAWRLPRDRVRPEMAAVTGEVLFTRESDTSFAGYDLATGERRWSAELPSATQLFGVDGDGRPLLAHPVNDDGLRLFRLDAPDGAESPAGRVPLDPERSSDEVTVAFDGHQLYTLTPVTREGSEGLRLAAYER
ncbi:hypothetical protein D7319_06730 [Streptomyces radicis]|uniref:Pyrrolo-quinoline quinone repeat domain-containing protein n=1 Tax=Streptomyces radicis TaxID=1750517 RepID=A0A3A9WQ29_9ACTN|nr:hypothetical protein D7319_06730 [Streptomyces radicis]RKN26377.1 hypothetical protein D7318_02930 [Streptomyces radicis]